MQLLFIKDKVFWLVICSFKSFCVIKRSLVFLNGRFGHPDRAKFYSSDPGRFSRVTHLRSSQSPLKCSHTVAWVVCEILARLKRLGRLYENQALISTFDIGSKHKRAMHCRETHFFTHDLFNSYQMTRISLQIIVEGIKGHPGYNIAVDEFTFMCATSTGKCATSTACATSTCKYIWYKL